MSNIFIGLKKTCLGVLDKGDRDKDNETGLKEGVIKILTTVLHSRAALSLGRSNTNQLQCSIRDARSLRFEYLPSTCTVAFASSVSFCNSKSTDVSP